MSCSIWGCTNSVLSTADPSVHYYLFPKQPDLAQQWLAACGWTAEDIDLNNAQICSLHFSEDCYTTEVKIIDYMTCYTKILKFDALPSLYLPLNIEKSEPEIELREMIVFASENENPDLVPVEEIDLENYKHINTKEALQELENENKSLREQVQMAEINVQKLKVNLNRLMESFKQKDVEVLNLHNEYLESRQSFLSAQQQKNLLNKVFSESQIKILSGKKKIYWSNDDMAVGYTIRHLSNKSCYLYLTKKLNIPLPAVSSIKRWMNIKNNERKSLAAIEKRSDANEDDSE